MFAACQSQEHLPRKRRFCYCCQSSHPAVSEEDVKIEAVPGKTADERKPKGTRTTLETPEHEKGKSPNRNTWNYVEEKQFLQVCKEFTIAEELDSCMTSAVYKLMNAIYRQAFCLLVHPLYF